MDSGRAATGLVGDPRGSLTRLAERAGTAFGNFEATSRLTRSELDRVRADLEGTDLAERLSIVVFGSWARDELTPKSDHDWALLAAEPFDADDPQIGAAMAAAGERVASTAVAA